jgi:hypothetical protein
MSGMAGLATREWFALASSVAAQVTAAVLVAGLAARVLFRRDAAARHGLWLGGLIWVLLSPAVAAVVNRWDFAPRAGRLRLPAIVAVPPADRIDARVGAAGRSAEMPRPRDRGEAHPIGAVPPARPLAAGEGMAEQSSSPAPAVGKGRTAGVPGMPRWQDLFLAGMTAWGVGILVGLLRTVNGYRRVAAMCRRARPLDPGRHGDALAEAVSALGMVAPPRVVTSPSAAGPLATGLLRPTIVLPEALPEALPAGALRDVLVHEEAHLLRRDLWVGLLQRLAAVLFWPHPLVHYLNVQLARAREEVCDNYVLGLGDPCAYARTLVALTELCRPPGACRAGLGLLGTRWTPAASAASLTRGGWPRRAHPSGPGSP